MKPVFLVFISCYIVTCAGIHNKDVFIANDVNNPAASGRGMDPSQRIKVVGQIGGEK
jgi:hypothetical protein